MDALGGGRHGARLKCRANCWVRREQLKTLMDRAVDDREVIVVRRRSGGDVAMIAADELQGLIETAHLLRSGKNASRLLAALSRARGTPLKPTSLAELESKVGLDA